MGDAAAAKRGVHIHALEFAVFRTDVMVMGIGYFSLSNRW
jgi:hypothetical protein